MNITNSIIFTTIFALTACSSTKSVSETNPDAALEKEPVYSPLQNPTLQATLWVQNSAEYKALAVQAYETAKRVLQLPLNDSYWTASLSQQEKENYNSLPPAIILDVDETVLDNSPFQARLIAQGKGYSEEAWNEWCLEANADAVPGAAEFTSYAAENGVTIFYVTNRTKEVEEATNTNLLEQGFPVSDSMDVILTKGEQPEWTSSKIERRNYIEENYRVLMLFGDDLNDFLPAKGRTLKERDQMIADYTSYFGRRWFIVPNPVYGSWEQSLLNPENEASLDEVKPKRLNTKEHE